MVDSPLRTTLLVIAALFLTTPIWAPALDVTGAEHQYHSAPVTVEDNRIQVEEPRVNGFEGIDCFQAVRESRLCAFEARLLEGSSNQSVGPSVENTSRYGLYAQDQYVAVDADGQVFERTWVLNESAGTYELGLQRANASRVLEEIARPVGEHPRPVRRAVETGSAWTEESLSEPQLVTSDGRTYIVYDRGRRTFLSEKPLVERLFELLSMGIGLLLFDRTRRMEW